MQCGGGRRGGELLAKRLVTEHLRELRQQLKVFLGGVFRHQQHEYLRHRPAVGSVERDRLLRSYERTQRLLQPLDAAMWNRDALAETGGTQSLARRQTVNDDRSRQLRVLGEQLGDLLE